MVKIEGCWCFTLYALAVSGTPPHSPVNWFLVLLASSFSTLMALEEEKKDYWMVTAYRKERSREKRENSLGRRVRGWRPEKWCNGKNDNWAENSNEKTYRLDGKLTAKEQEHECAWAINITSILWEKCSHLPNKHVVWDVVKMSSVLEPRSSRRNVISGALSFHLKQLHKISNHNFSYCFYEQTKSCISYTIQCLS